jgi:hypothetical protein
LVYFNNEIVLRVLASVYIIFLYKTTPKMICILVYVGISRNTPFTRSISIFYLISFSFSFDCLVGKLSFIQWCNEIDYVSEKLFPLNTKDKSYYGFLQHLNSSLLDCWNVYFYKIINSWNMCPCSKYVFLHGF